MNEHGCPFCGESNHKTMGQLVFTKTDPSALDPLPIIEPRACYIC
jgi:hypothetical protein